MLLHYETIVDQIMFCFYIQLFNLFEYSLYLADFLKIKIKNICERVNTEKSS